MRVENNIEMYLKGNGFVIYLFEQLLKMPLYNSLHSVFGGGVLITRAAHWRFKFASNTDRFRINYIFCHQIVYNDCKHMFFVQ